VASRNVKWLVVLMSLVTGTTLHAAPTIGDSNAKISQALLPYSDRGKACDSEVSLLSGAADTTLAKVAADILKPPDLTSPLVLPPGTKPLPAVPAALFMSLTGFLCVTLVRDRKTWLAGIAFLLWAGQTGFAALPQAASHLVGGKQLTRYLQQQQYHSSALQERASRLRSDLEGTEYIGLLHHLEGIPIKIRNNTKHDIRNTIFALNTVSPYLNESLNCLAFEVRQFFCFSPAFIFENIPRGPPTLA
jgi:hypothetical protein